MMKCLCIMVVDDEEPILKLLRANLSLEEQEPDLVILGMSNLDKGE